MTINRFTVHSNIAVPFGMYWRLQGFHWIVSIWLFWVFVCGGRFLLAHIFFLIIHILLHMPWKSQVKTYAHVSAYHFYYFQNHCEQLQMILVSEIDVLIWQIHFNRIVDIIHSVRHYMPSTYSLCQKMEMRWLIKKSHKWKKTQRISRIKITPGHR